MRVQCCRETLGAALLPSAREQASMKSHEGELVREISKLQGIVAELKAGFSRALLELSHIQHGDSRLQSQLQETQSCCHKRALHLEALVQSLREELGEVRAQIRLLCGDRFKPDQESKMPQSAEACAQGSGVPQGDSETGHSSNMCQRENGGCPCQCSGSSATVAPSATLKAGLLLHCYLQGLRAGQCQGTDSTVNCQVVPMCVRVPQAVIGPWAGEVPRPCSLEGRRQQVMVQLLQSEWEYVSSLGQLYDKYKSPPQQANDVEPHKVFLRHVEQLLQRHLVFRNALEERLAADQWRCLVGDVFSKLTGQGEGGFSEAYLGYVSTLPTILNAEISKVQLAAKTHNTQDGQEKKEGSGLISLLFSPVSRIHSYLSIIQSLLDWTGGDHPDRHLLEDTQRILGHIRSRGHAMLEQDVQSEERPAVVTGLRCEIPSPDCPPSAFSKYSPNSRDTLTRSQTHRQDTQPANSHPSSICHPVPSSASWNHVAPSLGCGTWSLPPDATPVRVPGPRERPGDVRFLLYPSDPGGGAATDSDPGQGTSSQPLGKRMYNSEVYHINRPVVDFETDPEELGEASVFDYSSVTTCSPDDTLELHGNGLERSNGTEESRGEEEEEEEEEEEDEEDSQIPVLLKPSYTLPRLKPSSQRPPLSPRLVHRDGAVCTRWQIPRAAPNPPTHTQAHAHIHTQMQAGGQVCVAAGPGGERRERRMKLQRQPSRAFRPIWDQPYRQGDETPDRDQSQAHRGVTSQGHSGSNPQKDRDGVRSSLYGGGGRGSPVGPLGNRNVWNESEDSEGPCSTV
ncbi:uncharacterized protein LOC121692891 isoform X2 [Alosa sapidissima]|uniref:uncharacterized protein LOC121692891 isoform X2 n=1 Tax=Alosa sapidissima TaxID=34773 RepID=UPI001C08A92D|nr:uncharacterized protein LOC121692891 isoform X2 [Alosa sapidissima]